MYESSGVASGFPKVSGGVHTAKLGLGTSKVIRVQTEGYKLRGLLSLVWLRVTGEANV